MRNFLVLESNFGPFIINRHDRLQGPALLLSGRPHIQGELDKILGLVARLPPEAIVVDAGANAGLVSVPIAQLLAPKAGRVLAFEVQRMMYYALCGTVALNGLENLFVYHLGLGDSLREAAIAPPDYGVLQDFGTFSLLEQGGANPSEQVSIVTIDSLELPRLDFLKIDVEGMDIEVLRGGANTIRTHRPWCWVEYWKVGAPQVKGAFNAEGYEFFVMDDLNLLCAPRERIAEVGINIDAPRV
ncbi:MAG TPA: FkbM family methyltransferase [Caulobacteraceae bacterium]|jgi:FkbM family methyltransferase|nr:FkbM family methyltransferase [Caulobacteraceae bacterium]